MSVDRRSLRVAAVQATPVCFDRGATLKIVADHIVMFAAAGTLVRVYFIMAGAIEPAAGTQLVQDLGNRPDH